MRALSNTVTTALFLFLAILLASVVYTTVRSIDFPEVEREKPVLAVFDVIQRDKEVCLLITRASGSGTLNLFKDGELVSSSNISLNTDIACTPIRIPEDGVYEVVLSGRLVHRTAEFLKKNDFPPSITLPPLCGSTVNTDVNLLFEAYDEWGVEVFSYTLTGTFTGSDTNTGPSERLTLSYTTSCPDNTVCEYDFSLYARDIHNNESNAFCSVTVSKLSPPVLTLSPDLNNSEYLSNVSATLSCSPSCTSLEYNLWRNGVLERSSSGVDSLTVSTSCGFGNDCSYRLEACGTNASGTTCEEWTFVVDRFYYVEFNDFQFEFNVYEGRRVALVGSSIEGVDINGKWVTITLDSLSATLYATFPKGEVEGGKLYRGGASTLGVHTKDGFLSAYSVSSSRVLAVEGNMILYADSTNTYLCDISFSSCKRVAPFSSVTGDIFVDKTSSNYYVLIYDGNTAYVYGFTSSFSLTVSTAFVPPSTPLAVGYINEVVIVAGDGFLALVEGNTPLYFVSAGDWVYTDVHPLDYVNGLPPNVYFLLAGSVLNPDNTLTPSRVEYVVADVASAGTTTSVTRYIYDVPAFSILEGSEGLYFVSDRGYGVLKRDGTACVDTTAFTVSGTSKIVTSATPLTPVADIPPSSVSAVDSFVTVSRVTGTKIC